MADLNFATTPRRPCAAAIPGHEIGIAWWNHMTRQERADALRAANTAVPVEAWKYWYERQMVADSAPLIHTSIQPEVRHAD